MTTSDTDDADEALRAAKRLASEGKFAEALERHIWYHENALAINRAHSGVRLSYAIAYWVELARAYPPALEALRKIRAANAARLLTGEAKRELFRDTESIDNHLQEAAATVELFKTIAVRQPDFAESIYDLAEAALLATEDYALAKAYLGDPLARFAAAKRDYEFGVNHPGEGRAAEAARRADESNFTDSVIRIITILNKTGDHDAALQIQKQALAVLENDTIKSTLPN